MDWFKLWLTLHIVGAIIAFGPSFAFPLLGRLAERNPQHAIFALGFTDVVEKRLILPLALSMPVTGAAMIIDTHIDLRATRWLGAAIVLYAVALGLAVFHQIPVTHRMISMLRSAPAPAPGADAAPPAGFLTLRNRAKFVGMTLGLLVIVITVLMVWAPGGIHYS